MNPQDHYETAPEDRISIPQKLIYGLGAFVNNLLAAAIGGMTIVLNLGLGMNPALVGLLGALPRLTDALTDPLMGFISDNTRSRWGRRRPYIFIGAIAAGILFALLWQLPPGRSENYYFWFFLVGSLFFYLAYTIFATPWVALGYELTPDYHERTRLMGVQFMAAAGYDPRAAARVWRMIVEEEERAAVKREDPSIFTMTHPSSEERIAALDAFVAANYGDAGEKYRPPSRHVEILNLYYPMLMEDQLDTNRFGRTEAMLERHREIGVDDSLINFFLGEMYRQRGQEGDLERAEQAYRLSTTGAFPLPAAHHQLGYVYMKRGANDLAKENFEKYLEMEPDSDERAMIEFYLEDL